MRLTLALLLIAGCTHDAGDPRPGSDPLAPSPLAPDALSADSLAGTFEGHYSAGMEHAGFVACADTSQTWWTEETLEMGQAYQRVTETEGATVTPEGPVVWARLRGRATPLARSQRGHLGAYDRTFRVDSAEAFVRDTVVAGCPAPRSTRP